MSEDNKQMSNSQEKFGTVPEVDPVTAARGSRSLDEGISQRLSWPEDAVGSGTTSEQNSTVPTYQPNSDSTGRV